MKSSIKNQGLPWNSQDFSSQPMTTFASTFPFEQHPAFDVLNQLPQLIWVKTKHQQNFFNHALCEYTDLNAKTIPTSKWQRFIHPEDHEHFLCLLKSTHTLQQNVVKECRIKNHKQKYYWFKVEIKYQAHHLFEWVISCHNIHDAVIQRKLLKQQVVRQNKIFDASHDCIKILHPNGQIAYINEYGRQALALPKETVDMQWLPLLAKQSKYQALQALRNAQKGQQARFAGLSIHPDQPPRYWDNLLTPILNQFGEVQRILCISRDISQQTLSEQRLQHANSTDDLTQLYNRRAFNVLIDSSLKQAELAKHDVGLLMLDLDYFKNLNDTLGHIAGDHLLKVLASRLRRCFNENLKIARFGNDEFTIIVPELKSEQQLIEYANLAQQQLLAPIYYAGHYLNSGLSIGCAIYPQHANTPSNLIRCAETALSDLKQKGRGGVAVFNQHMLDILEQKAQELILARDVIRNGRLLPFYQPKVNLKDGHLIGFEALLRWYDHEGNIQSPAQINEAFRDYELATRISDAIQHKVFQDITLWRQKNLNLVPIAINAAPVEFLRDNYAETLLQRLAEYQLPAECIEIEITEQSLEEQSSSYVLRALKCLKEAGIRIALDDFGTGHSSLTRLKDYPIDIIKIDRSFIEKMHSDQSIFAIVNAIGQLGPSMKIEILAEGIEQAEHIPTLQQCQCVSGQGFLFHRPMSMQAATQLMQK